MTIQTYRISYTSPWLYKLHYHTKLGSDDANSDPPVMEKHCFKSYHIPHQQYWWLSIYKSRNTKTWIRFLMHEIKNAAWKNHRPNSSFQPSMTDVETIEPPQTIARTVVMFCSRPCCTSLWMMLLYTAAKVAPQAGSTRNLWSSGDKKSLGNLWTRKINFCSRHLLQYLNCCCLTIFSPKKCFS